MTAQDLKNSILQLAIQGKLVKQRPEEGTAKELLEQIKAEKKQLIKTGKNKKKKFSPEINEDEIPFEIPENWEWVRFGNIVNMVSSRRVHQADWKSEGIHFYRAREIAKLAEYGTVDNELFISEKLYDGYSSSGVPKENDLMVTAVGTLGKTYIVKKEDKFYYKDASVICLENYASISSDYLKCIMESQMMKNQIDSNSAGTTVATLTLIRMNDYLVPLPPLEEQKRIVAKIEELLPYVEQYDKAYSKLEVFNKKFPENMQKSILQYAIQGKLVEQRPEEGTAEELYQQIQAEKAKLIKEGKIKKEKPLGEITDEEIPFEIPESWKWVRLNEIISILGDGIHGTPLYDEMGEYFFINGNNLTDGKIEIKDITKKVNKREYEKYKKDLKSSTLFVSINGTIGNVAFYNNENVILGKSACYFNLIKEDVKFYMYWMIKTNYFLRYASDNATGSTIKNVSLATMKNFLVPLPPIEEQRRITAKIEELLPYCQQLVKWKL